MPSESDWELATRLLVASVAAFTAVACTVSDPRWWIAPDVLLVASYVHLVVTATGRTWADVSDAVSTGLGWRLD